MKAQIQNHSKPEYREIPLALAVAAISILAMSGLPAAAITYTNATVDDSGAGFGNVLNLLSVQNDTSEWGSVLYDAGGIQQLGGHAKVSSQIRTVIEMSAPPVSMHSGNFGVIFNINEAAAPKDVVLNGFHLRFYTNPSDLSEYFEADYPAPPGGLTLLTAGSGTGNAGHLFQVTFTPSEAALFFGNSANSVGAYVSESQAITDTSDGQENFYLIAIPEPSSGLLGLLGAAVLLRRRRN